ncbi:MAG: Cbb3-type cytochrome oxidase component FixQ [Hyphomicrobiales bacterium]|nr:Cbb3-type cytochrome oxidase component FixQ [Hyphomicrobiales bacterium]
MNIQPYLHDAQIISLVSVCITFTGIVVYALWPSQKLKFDRMSRLPLNED